MGGLQRLDYNGWTTIDGWITKKTLTGGAVVEGTTHVPDDVLLARITRFCLAVQHHGLHHQGQASKSCQISNSSVCRQVNKQNKMDILICLKYF